LIGNVEKVFIACDQQIRLASDRGSQHPTVGGIPNRKIGGVKRLGNDGLISELVFDLLDTGGSYSKRAPAQNRPKFGKIDFSR